MKFENLKDFIEYYEKLTREKGTANNYYTGLSKVSGRIPYKNRNVLSYVDDYVLVILSLDSDSMVIERKENYNTVYNRINGEVIRTNAEWILCQDK